MERVKTYSLKEKLELAQECEEAVARLYDIMAQRYQPGTDLGNLFAGLASEEREHAARVSRLNEKLTENPATAKVELAMDKLSELLQEIRQLEQMMSASDYLPPSDALNLTRSLEERFQQVHAETLAENADPAVRKLFASLADDDRHHAELIARGVVDETTLK